MDENRSKWLRETAVDLMLNSGEKVADVQAMAGNALDKVTGFTDADIARLRELMLESAAVCVRNTRPCR